MQVAKSRCFLRAFPRLIIEQHKNRDNLKSADEHVEHKHDFLEDAVGGEVACRADFADAGAYVVEAGDDGGEVGGDAACARIRREDGKDDC